MVKLCAAKDLVSTLASTNPHTHPSDLASAKYAEYKPVLEEIERIQREAEVESSSTKRAMGTAGESGRNRR